MINEQQTQMLTTLAHGLSIPPRLPVLRKPEEYGLEYEEISFVTQDGITIQGWFFPADSNKVIISNHFSPGNKYGFAGHLEWLDFAGGFEVNFLPRYKALHEAGYNVLAYDLRGHGDSESGEKNLSGVGYWEWQEVLASIDYIKNRPDTVDHDISLMSMCMGANATLNAMEKKPEAFKEINCLLAVAPLKGRTTIERNCEHMQIPVEEGVDAFGPIYNGLTGLRVEDHNIIPKAKNINIPTFFVQVRDDMNSRWTDVQEMYDLTPVSDKKIYYIEGTPWRFKGYTYFSENPEQMVEWFDAHM
ncbi:MAG: alpha/beta hydrolase [Rhodothermaceae bacterium]|nr:alpha/beta hydrolase [Rhodothermaceae bacterium]